MTKCGFPTYWLTGTYEIDRVTCGNCLKQRIPPEPAYIKGGDEKVLHQEIERRGI